MKKIASALSWLLLVLLAAGVVGVAVPKVLGWQLFAVLSGSMRPYLDVGDLVYAAPADFDEIKKGDVISFVIDENLTVVTHRVADIDEENRRFITKGDANTTNDSSSVKYENVLGVVRLNVPKVGRLAMAVSTRRGKVVAITAIIALASVSVMVNSLVAVSKKKENSDE